MDQAGSRAMDESEVVPSATEQPQADGPDDGGKEPVVDTTPELSRLESIIESLLFAAGAPVPLRRLVQLLDGPSTKEVAAVLARLARCYESNRRGMRLVEVAGGYQLRTARENADWVRTLLQEKPVRMARGTLETLAIVAYRQPVTRAEIEAIRGVDVEGSLGSLLSKRLIKIAGRKETVGRPLLYVTTPDFLEVFGLRDLSELPALKELPSGDSDEKSEPSSDQAQEAESTTGTGVATAAEAAESGGGELPESGGGVDSLREGAD